MTRVLAAVLTVMLPVMQAGSVQAEGPARPDVPAGTAAIEVPAAAGADSFTLTATERDFGNYYPTYLANGYWSVASSLLGTDAAPAQIVGVMDYTPNDVSRPAAIPSWNEIDYFDGSQWLNDGKVGPQTHLHYRQTLDMRDGLLHTRYRWRSRGHDTDLAVTSFVSQSAAHLAAVTLELTPHFSGVVKVRFTLRLPPAPHRLPLAELTAEQFAAAAAAGNQPQLAQGGNREAIWYAGQVGITAKGSDAAADTLWMEAKAIGGRAVALGSAIALPKNLRLLRKTAGQTGDAVLLDIEAAVERGHSYRFTKFVSASAEGWSVDGKDLPGHPASAAAAARGEGLGALRSAHAAAWRELWRSDILVGGNEALQRTLHSDLFYVLENSAPGTHWPAAACGFSSRYFGHVFWDNDFWVFPSLLLLHPERARSLISFRQITLPQAIARAKAHGFDGAMYPWEADPWSGVDVTPKFAAENADREIHVNGAVALAQWQYFLASGDLKWLRERAFPVIEAVADFWVSRATFNQSKQRFELKDVTSPEEDYTHVDNEIYTNQVAHESLKAAIAAAAVLGVAPNRRWQEVADRLYLPAAAKDAPYYDFDPSTAHDKSASWMATSVPMLSIPALGFEAEPAVMNALLHHSVEAIEPMRGRANQMVLVMLAIEAAVAGDERDFGEFLGGGSANAPAAVSAVGPDPFLKPPFNVRSETPQNNSLYLLATSGGFLQSFIFGLSGLRLGNEGLTERFPPRLPGRLTYLKLKNIEVRGKTADVVISRVSGRVVRHINGRQD